MIENYKKNLPKIDLLVYSSVPCSAYYCSAGLVSLTIANNFSFSSNFSSLNTWKSFLKKNVQQMKFYDFLLGNPVDSFMDQLVDNLVGSYFNTLKSQCTQNFLFPNVQVVVF